MKAKRTKYKDKEINLASTGRVEGAGEIADDFMFEIFDFDAGEYLITDESRLSDFTDVGSTDVAPIWNRIEHCYGITARDVESDKLVDIFDEIIGRKHVQ